MGGPLLKRNARGWEKTRHSETKHLARVAHPDFVAQSPSGRTVIVFQPDESYSALDLLLMSELEVQSANGSNG